MNTLDATLNENASKYERIKQQARERQKRYYDKHQEQILLKKKEQRDLFNELKKQQQQATQPTKRTIVQPIQPIEELPVFSNLSKEQIKNIRKTNKSTTNLKEIIERLKNFSLSGSQDTYKTYRTNVEQLYTITNTPKNKAINLNDVKFIFDTLDNFKKPNGEQYGIDKQFLLIQVILIIADPTNHFGLDVNKQALDIYKSKFNEFKILKSRKQERNQKKEVPLFSDILKKAKTHFGLNSEFYLYLKVYSLSPTRDNHQIIIIDDVRKATKKTENYIVVKKNTGTVIINVYKTQERYGQLKYELTPEVVKMIQEYIVTKKLQFNKEDYLFGNGKLSNWVKSCLKQIGIDIPNQAVNTLRHSLVTEFHLLNPGASAKELDEFSVKMGHSSNTDKSYIRKIGAL